MFVQTVDPLSQRARADLKMHVCARMLKPFRLPDLQKLQKKQVMRTLNKSMTDTKITLLYSVPWRGVNEPEDG